MCGSHPLGATSASPGHGCPLPSLRRADAGRLHHGHRGGPGPEPAAPAHPHLQRQLGPRGQRQDGGRARSPGCGRFPQRGRPGKPSPGLGGHRDTRTPCSPPSALQQGRGGLGSVFIWASGNGGTNYDNCNCDGYTNSIYTVSVGSVLGDGQRPRYGESCSAILTTTYSSRTTSKVQIVSVTTALPGQQLRARHRPQHRAGASPPQLGVCVPKGEFSEGACYV